MNTIQVVCVKWGTAYRANCVNSLYRSVIANTSEPVRFVCITDETPAAFDAGIHVHPFPDLGVPANRLTKGCLLKLGMFAEGVLEPDLPTVYVDLDTIVTGDVGRLAERLRSRAAIYLMQGHRIPTWRVSGLAKRIAPRFYYHGNSSVLAFYPQDYHFLAELFKQKWHTGEPYFPKVFSVDDRFISCFARDTLRVFSSRDVVKFGSEFASPIPWVEAICRRLPQVVRRRRGLVAITFAGNDLTPEKVARFSVGQRVKVKRRTLTWNYPEFSRYWSDVLSGRQRPGARTASAATSATGGTGSLSGSAASRATAATHRSRAKTAPPALAPPANQAKLHRTIKGTPSSIG